VDGSPGRIRWTRLGRKVYGDCLETERDEEGTTWFRFGSDPMQYIDDGETDEVDWKVVEEGDISITPLCLNMTDETFLRALKSGHYGGAIRGYPGVETSPEKHG
jgi:broad specificity polyphosphatase/5'/3'-nucleotidase SurE